MTEHDPHSSPIKTPKQLIIVVVLAFLVPITVIGLLSQLFTSTGRDAHEDEQHVLERIKPVGTIVMAEASAPHGSLSGEQVFAQVCKTCHETGVAGAPKAGDKTAWGPRIAEGEKTLVAHAIGGYQGKTGVMPPKGGSTDLTDDEVHRAVVYLADQAGAGWKEPAPTATASAALATAPVAAASPAPSTATASAAPVATAIAATAVAATPAATASPTTTASAGVANGKAVYDETCHVCHATGLAGSPKLGDKAAWAPRIATGIETLHKAAINGLNAMPPRGGNASLTDAQVKAAVDYMVSAAK
ncbi:MAG: c-type cytochrome [Pseudomonadota bacterium]|nr:c-type cytochrome [Pseudomonadota bacterium]